MKRQPDPDELVPAKCSKELALYLIRDSLENLPNLNHKNLEIRKIAIDSEDFLNGNGHFQFWLMASGLDPAWFEKSVKRYRENINK